MNYAEGNALFYSVINTQFLDSDSEEWATFHFVNTQNEVINFENSIMSVLPHTGIVRDVDGNSTPGTLVWTGFDDSGLQVKYNGVATTPMFHFFNFFIFQRLRPLKTIATIGLA
jgi:hypothetical protein